MSRLPLSYFRNQDVLFLAKDLLGKLLCTCVHGEQTTAMIVETEAYGGAGDKASHAYGNRRTGRTEIIYQEGGVAYVYLCYGIHHLINIVTSVRDEPYCVLIRAVAPVAGKEIIERRRNMTVERAGISSGPGSVSKAMGIDQSFNAKSLDGTAIWIEDHGFRFTDQEIVAATRIGVAYAEEHAALPWRFYIRGNKYVSKPVK